MVVRYLNVAGSGIRPTKTNSILIIYPNTVLTFAVSPQTLQAVPWWNQQVIQ